MWVNPKFLFRPAPATEISAPEAELISPVSEDWLNEQEEKSFKQDAQGNYGDKAQPWTALGYTYDWGNPRTDVGLSEFVIQKGNPDKPADSSSIEAISRTPIEEYCNISAPGSVLATTQNPTNTMLIPNILNVAINLLFIYLVLSLLLSALQEQVVVFLALRAKNLKSSIETLLGDGAQRAKLLTNDLYKHPLIKSLNQQGNKWLKGIINKLSTILKQILNTNKNLLTWKSVGPSYLKPQTFSNTLLALLQKDYGLDFNTYSDETEQIIRQLKEELDRRKQKQLPANSLAILKGPETLGIYLLLRMILQKWYALPDDLLENLYALARQTKNKADKGKANCLQSKFQEIDVNDIRSFPIGWQVQQTNTNSSFFNYDISLKRQQSLFFTMFGWLITAFALAQGAPFWFDLLNKAINVRSSVSVKSNKSEQEMILIPISLHNSEFYILHSTTGKLFPA